MDKKQKIRIRNNLAAAFGAAILVCLWSFAHLSGRTLVSNLQFAISLCVFIGVSSGFVFLVASGKSRRFADPSLTFPQMMWAVATTTFFMSLSSAPSEPYYFLLSIVLIFGVFRMLPREFTIFAVFTIIIVGVHKLSSLSQTSSTVDIIDIALTWGVFVCCTLILVSLCRSISSLRSRLRDRNKRLEEALEVKTRFLANMSHELRTPINGMLGMLELMQQSELDRHQARYAKLAAANARSLLSIVSDVLDISKADAGKIQLQSKDVDLLQLLIQVAETNALDAHNKGLDFVVDFSELGVSVIRSDPLRLQQILCNLLQNAIKFTSSGFIHLRVSASDTDDQNVHVHIAIRDSGIGIPEEKLEKIFDSFAQVDASSTRAFGGTGLGLAIVRELCDLFGSSVNVTSRVDEGSSFSVDFDFNKAESAAEESKLSISARTSTDLAQRSVVVIENSALQREALVGQLEKWGAEVLAFSDPESLNKANDVDLQKRLATASAVLVNSVFLGEDAASLDTFQRRFFSAKIPCIAIVNTVSVRATSSSLPCVPLSKPITPDKLIASLEQAEHFIAPQATLESSDQQGEFYVPPVKDKRRKRRVLLVDDNEINREVAGGFLESLDLDYDVAGNGIEAIEKLCATSGEDPYLLVLMDCQMPEMDGYEASRKIRDGHAGEHNDNIPIVALTANAMKGDEEKCSEAGMSDYISKPIDFDVFERKLSEYLHKAKAAVPSQSSEPTFAPRDTATAEPAADEWSETPDEERVPQSEAAKFIWDKAAALLRVRGKHDRLRRLVNLFTTSMPDNIKQLEKAVEEKRDSDIRKIAHGMRGVSANLGGISLADTLDKLEHLDLANDGDALHTLVKKVNDDFSSLQQLLLAYLNES